VAFGDSTLVSIRGVAGGTTPALLACMAKKKLRMNRETVVVLSQENLAQVVAGHDLALAWVPRLITRVTNCTYGC
jgi:hypothetical protein